MSFPHILYQLFLGPLQLIYEFVFYYAKIFTNSPGLSIIVLSILMNFFLLPLYRRADAIQNEEREKEKSMEHWVKHIKKAFSGSERFMMLQTYYRQNNYKPYYVLKGMLPLMLEIPFFIAAFNYLSSLGDLQTSFGPIANLSVPDGLIHIGGVDINLLPILMTVINIISGAVYTKGLRLKDKLQMYGMAAVFLVLLYNSPSGLVVYWTMNNLFSLVRNIVEKLSPPRRAVLNTISATGVLSAALGLLLPKDTFSDGLFLVYLGLILQIPLLIAFAKSKSRSSPVKKKFSIGQHKPDLRLFISGCVLLTLLTGVLIPSAVVSSSPVEFVLVTDYHNPILHVLDSFLLAAGMFIVWFGLLYYLSGKTVRWLLSIAVWVISGVSLINYMFFATNLGTITSDLKYDRTPKISTAEQLINLGVILAAVIVFGIVWKKSKRAVQSVYIVLGLVVSGMAVFNIANIASAVPEIQASAENIEYIDADAADGSGKIIHLSKTGKNVVVIMADRAVSSYIPYLFAEKPELEKQFDGFTYYPNTLSYGAWTIFGAPAVFGGYEYTPEEMNARSDEKLVDKHNEALRVMPVLFDDNGYDVTVVDPSYAGYSWIGDIGIYSDRPEIKAYNLEQGQMNTGAFSSQFKSLNEVWQRNFFCYSLMKTAPCVLQPWLYQDGYYHSSNASLEYINSMSQSNSVGEGFLNSYAVLNGLSSITESDEGGKGSFLMLCNCTTHEPQLLKEPEYVPASYVNNASFDYNNQGRFTADGKTMRVENKQQMQHYQINMAAMLKLGEWFDYLRENGVYDNTRIIIVSDHGGYNLCQFDDTILPDEEKGDVLSYNPLLLVKDFNSRGFKTDNCFMTNADVPSLALSSVVNDPVNPFTGKPLNSEAKKGEQNVLFSEKWSISLNGGNTFQPGQWYTVHDDIFNIDNWTKKDIH